jgi:hypothetical protein
MVKSTKSASLQMTVALIKVRFTNWPMKVLVRFNSKGG